MMPARGSGRKTKMSPSEFVDWIKQLIQSSSEELYAIGIVDPDYQGGRPRIKFEGEPNLSTKEYPYLSSYTPQAGDRVFMIRTRYGYLILGKIM